MTAGTHGAAVRDIVAICRKAVDPAYRRADARALRSQREHRTIVDCLAVTGTLAVLAGIVPLADSLSRTAAKTTEIISAVAALLTVAIGVWAGFERRWLLERHKAERLRLLEFHSLLTFAAHGCASGIATWETALRNEVAQIERLTEDDMRHWLAEEPVADARIETRRHPLAAEIVHEVAREYRTRRLDAQAAYFLEKAQRNERWDELTRPLVPLLFFVSVGSIAPAAALRLFTPNTAAGAAFLVLAAGAPAIAAGIRLFRSAHEFARNSIRFRGKYLVLRLLAERLRAETSVAVVLRDLWYAETILEAEHREWLRLMIEAEWFG